MRDKKRSCFGGESANVERTSAMYAAAFSREMGEFMVAWVERVIGVWFWMVGQILVAGERRRAFAVVLKKKWMMAGRRLRYGFDKY